MTATRSCPGQHDNPGGEERQPHSQKAWQADIPWLPEAHHDKSNALRPKSKIPVRFWAQLAFEFIEGARARSARASGEEMNDEHRQLLSLVGQPPARLTVEQTSCLLNCQPWDIPVLISARLLKPLGNPLPNSRKYFAAVEIIDLMRDRSWLSRVTSTLQQYWLRRNGSKGLRQADEAQEGTGDDSSPLAPPGNGRRPIQRVEHA
jgi:hypothetical protein